MEWFRSNTGGIATASSTFRQYMDNLVYEEWNLSKVLTADGICLRVATDALLAISGQRSWFKAILGTGVGYVAMRLSGWAGILIDTGYFLFDQMGAFDRPIIDNSHCQHPVCPRDATQVIIHRYPQ